jgi:hypothetical protein
MLSGSSVAARSRRWRWWLVIGPLVGAVVAVSWFTYSATVQAVHDQVRRRLEADLAATTRALTGWMQMKTLEAEVLAHRSDVRVGVLGLLAGKQDLRENLRATLQEDVFGLGFDGFAVVDRAGKVVLAVDGDGDGKPVGKGARAALIRALDAPSLITPPLSDPFGDGGPTRLLTLVAIDGRAGPAAVLMLTMAPERQFSGIIDIGHDRATAVAHAFDRDGNVLNRRSDQAVPALRAGGDGDLLPVVASAIAKGSGIDLGGGRDQHGRVRVSAAQWFDDLGIGLYIAKDHAVVMRPVTIARASVLGMSLLLLLGSVAAAIYWWSNRALGRRLARAQATIAELGQYQLTRKLGEGGMGAVYLATHRMMRREVAVKLITGKADPESIARFEREVQLCCTLTHPNTIQIFDYGRTDEGVFYYAMELLRGIDLEDVVGTYGPLPASRVIHLLVQACGSLAEAHDRHLIHRDIKPANLFLCERGGEVDVVKVLDFGLVKDTEVQSVSVSREDVISGTPQYLAPEIARQAKDVDGRSDLYSLACVGYFLLTGHCVFEHDNVMQMVIDHLNTAPVPPSARTRNPIPTDLEAVVMRSLAKDPAERFSDARAFAAALSGCAAAGAWTQAEARAWWTERGLPRPVATGAATTSKVAATLRVLGRRPGTA